jgi:hypothetical protein
MTAVMSVNVVPCGVGRLLMVTKLVFGMGICSKDVGLRMDGLVL